MFPHGCEGIMLDQTHNNVFLMLFLPLCGDIFPIFQLLSWAVIVTLAVWDLTLINLSWHQWSPETVSSSLINYLHSTLYWVGITILMNSCYGNSGLICCKSRIIELIWTSPFSHNKVNINNGNSKQERGQVDNIGGVS